MYNFSKVHALLHYPVVLGNEECYSHFFPGENEGEAFTFLQSQPAKS